MINIIIVSSTIIMTMAYLPLFKLHIPAIVAHQINKTSYLLSLLTKYQEVFND